MNAPRQWRIADFARFMAGGSGERVAMAMLVAYFDESGISDKDVVALMGGAVSYVDHWSLLEAPWNNVLRPYNQYGVHTFHAVDCEHGESEFKNPQLSRGIRDSIRNGVAQELAKIPVQGIVSAVYREDWASAPDEVRALSMGDPFYFVLNFCLQQVSSWSKEYAGGDRVNLVFAKQQKYNANTQSLHANYLAAANRWPGIGAIFFEEPKFLVPLQAADLIAYESYRFAVAHKKSNVPEAPNRAWKYLVGGGNLAMSFKVHDRASLQELVPSSG